MLAPRLRAIQISVLKLAADLDQEAGVKIHGLAGRLGLKMHCWAGWWGHHHLSSATARPPHRATKRNKGAKESTINLLRSLRASKSNKKDNSREFKFPLLEPAFLDSRQESIMNQRVVLLLPTHYL